MQRSPHGGGQPLMDRFLRSLWHSLVAFGSVYCGPVVHQELMASARAGHTGPPFARPARSATRPASLRGAGPVSGHPERLCEDLPLSETERLLARDLWPACDCGREAPGTG
ncbi:DUF6059 family protein [Streptomyces fructofermentans]|uniref:Uncharacterized protein n=1 Tax=Streptomyces fructofermentans TaxID=152141 RepID=A0A918U556_9ACTN|nr:DUF6059 family protein [Streptomyces fructofermentans]GGX93451.1 hypothetical protein GCM10010515_70430 [Streptomyces fructofermentans]